MKIRNTEIISASNEEIEKRIKELRSELMKLNTQVAVGSMLKSPSQPSAIKKTIAKIYTIRAAKRKSLNSQTSIPIKKGKLNIPKAGDEEKKG